MHYWPTFNFETQRFTENIAQCDNSPTEKDNIKGLFFVALNANAISSLPDLINLSQKCTRRC